MDLGINILYNPLFFAYIFGYNPLLPHLLGFLTPIGAKIIILLFSGQAVIP